MYSTYLSTKYVSKVFLSVKKYSQKGKHRKTWTKYFIKFSLVLIRMSDLNKGKKNR